MAGRAGASPQIPNWVSGAVTSGPVAAFLPGLGTGATQALRHKHPESQLVGAWTSVPSLPVAEGLGAAPHRRETAFVFPMVLSQPRLLRGHCPPPGRPLGRSPVSHCSIMGGVPNRSKHSRETGRNCLKGGIIQKSYTRRQETRLSHGTRPWAEGTPAAEGHSHSPWANFLHPVYKHSVST